MRIGIIGSGKIGGTLLNLLAGRGHEVAVANSRGPETLAGQVEEAGEGARAATVDEAADFGDVVVVAVPLHAYSELPADRLAGRIVADANNYYAERDGSIAELDDDSTTSSELLAGHLADSKVVKAFNTMNFRALGERGPPGRTARRATGHLPGRRRRGCQANGGRADRRPRLRPRRHGQPRRRRPPPAAGRSGLRRTTESARGRSSPLEGSDPGANRRDDRP